MSRIARRKAYTNVYHSIIRGINRQDIFFDKQDLKKFLKEMERTKEKYKYELYSYALMPNHVHFVLNDKNNNLSETIQSLTISYSSYFNKKYERIGHLFQDRFKSKPIEDEGYLKSVVRYVHKNPENAGIASHNKWTSYYDYITNRNGVTDTEFVMKLFKNNITEFKSFHDLYCKNQDIEKDYELINKLCDNEAIKIMKEIANEENLMQIQNYETKEKYEIIKKFVKIEGITKVQIARILGINRVTIQRMLQKGQVQM